MKATGRVLRSDCAKGLVLLESGGTTLRGVVPGQHPHELLPVET
jgi:hypothetical protein